MPAVCIYPGKRIKPIVLVMVYTGIRVGFWNYLKWVEYPASYKIL